MKIHERHMMRVRRKIQFEERKQENQRKVCNLFELVFYKRLSFGSKFMLPFYYIWLGLNFQVFTDSETVRWLNNTVEKLWPVCMEQIVSQKILLPIIPWFLEKYKPWTAVCIFNPFLWFELSVLGTNLS